MSWQRIPLFPLEVVLFPGATLPLHIFEPRYKMMIRRCRDQKEVFGVVLAREEDLAPVGCTAEIMTLAKEYPDGRMDIVTVGKTAYRVIEVFDDQPYLEASVEYLEDESNPGAAETQAQLVSLYQQCHTTIYGWTPEAPDLKPGRSLAFHIAGDLPLDLEHKQELLEMRAESERQSRLVERLSAWLPQLTYLERARAKAGGNGNGMK